MTGQNKIIYAINNINFTAYNNFAAITKLARQLNTNSKTTNCQTSDRTQGKVPESALLSGMEK